MPTRCSCSQTVLKMSSWKCHSCRHASIPNLARTCRVTAFLCPTPPILPRHFMSRRSICPRFFHGSAPKPAPFFPQRITPGTTTLLDKVRSKLLRPRHRRKAITSPVSGSLVRAGTNRIHISSACSGNAWPGIFINKIRRVSMTLTVRPFWASSLIYPKSCRH